MRTTLYAVVCALTAPSAAHAQTATVAGQVVARDGGEPLGFTTIAVLPRGAQRLASESGTFVLRDLPPGEVRVRFTRIGYAPLDTTLRLAAGTVTIRLAMTRLVIQLPAVANGRCTDRTPLDEQPAFLAALVDQVRQNAERMRLLASERPFVIQATRVQGIRAPRTDTVVRGPLPPEPYIPRRVYRCVGRACGVTLPELADIADTAFTNNHCLWYAGRERFGSDSVIRVDFEPVPWLAKEIDLEGSIYLRADGYRLVGMVTSLNRIPREFPNVRGYATRARFDELVSGVPVLAEWELTNTFRGAREPTVVETGRVTGVRWLDSPTEKPDTVRRPPPSR
jgi:hypothetical protein